MSLQLCVHQQVLPQLLQTVVQLNSRKHCLSTVVSIPNYLVQRCSINYGGVGGYYGRSLVNKQQKEEARPTQWQGCNIMYIKLVIGLKQHKICYNSKRKNFWMHPGSTQQLTTTVLGLLGGILPHQCPVVDAPRASFHLFGTPIRVPKSDGCLRPLHSA